MVMPTTYSLNDHKEKQADKKYQEILVPNFDSSKIGGLMDKQKVWFRANDKYRLNTFKEQFEEMFELDPLTINAWEEARGTFIDKIEAMADGEY